jgi:hypothetical protein
MNGSIAWNVRKVTAKTIQDNAKEPWIHMKTLNQEANPVLD